MCLLKRYVRAKNREPIKTQREFDFLPCNGRYKSVTGSYQGYQSYRRYKRYKLKSMEGEVRRNKCLVV